ncbi:MAG: hypothetical protein CVU52_11585 [Deltaproteobacteria bacterium HGW-Deltaproteobacteria-10]|nr:MAG: hypothetical protein CVU52_11585 [Deltaproteobacteria bacterium HGW-Deltaproteobacteria-10]
MVHPFADLIGLVFETQDQGMSLCRVEVHEKLYNPQFVIHGAILYALADTGMGGALYPLLEQDEFCATVEIKISYFQAVRSGSIECATRLISKGKTIAHLESEIRNAGHLVAKASGSFSIFRPNQDRKGRETA